MVDRHATTRCITVHAVACERETAMSVETGSAALRADAAESALCGYLSLIAFMGLLANTGSSLSSRICA